MNKIKNVSIFCGANKGYNPIYAKAANELANQLLNAGLDLVYGGGKVGLMGELADCVLSKGGKVIGVMPHFLVENEIAHPAVTELHIVESMGERKKKIAEISDAFILLPGGIGSLDEFFDMITLAQLGMHNKPRGILNTEHYFDDLLHFLNHSVKEGFWNQTNYSRLIVDSDPYQLLQSLMNYDAPLVTRWIKSEEGVESIT